MSFNPRILTISNYEQARKYMADIGVDEPGQRYMESKALFLTVRADGLSIPAANILKQEMLSRGGEAAIHREAVTYKVDQTSVILMGTIQQFKKLGTKLYVQPFKLAQLSRELNALITNLTTEQVSIDCLNGPLELGGRTLIMGIVNVTPDSFSDGGKYYQIDRAVEHALQLVEEGADIIDIGGESTRPGSEEISAEEELSRVLPVVKALVPQIKVPVSIDTYKAAVAEQVLDEGVAIINDIWGFQREQELAKVAARYNCPVVLMHNQKDTGYRDLIGDIIGFLRKSIEIADVAGVKADKIIIDPGIGFGKDLEQNLEVMHRLEELKSLGKPILLGTSRKSMIGKTLNLPATECLEGTAATVALGINKGIDIVRVHDVKEMARVVKMVDAIVRR
ncbi:MAG: dihydropteroate synthase [Bacillota bacterium]|jgi:dihydropteroate synthase